MQLHKLRDSHDHLVIEHGKERHAHEATRIHHITHAEKCDHEICELKDHHRDYKEKSERAHHELEVEMHEWRAKYHHEHECHEKLKHDLEEL
jgi:hypothetical protein